MRWCSASTSLFRFELLTILPFCAFKVATPVSDSPAHFSNIPFIPTHICFIPLSKSSFVILTVSFRIPSFYIISFAFFLAIACSSYILRVPLSFLLQPPSLPHPTIFLLCCILSTFTYYFTCCGLDQLFPSLYNPRSCSIPFHIVLCGTSAPQHLGKLRVSVFC